MSYETAMNQIRRERQTEEKLRKMDVCEIVDLVHNHEDEIERLRTALEQILRGNEHIIRFIEECKRP